MVWRNPTPKLDRNQPALLAAACPLMDGTRSARRSDSFPVLPRPRGIGFGPKGIRVEAELRPAMSFESDDVEADRRAVEAVLDYEPSRRFDDSRPLRRVDRLSRGAEAAGSPRADFHEDDERSPFRNEIELATAADPVSRDDSKQSPPVEPRGARFGIRPDLALRSHVTSDGNASRCRNAGCRRSPAAHEDMRTDSRTEADRRRASTSRIHSSACAL